MAIATSDNPLAGPSPSHARELLVSLALGLLTGALVYMSFAPLNVSWCAPLAALSIAYTASRLSRLANAAVLAGKKPRTKRHAMLFALGTVPMWLWLHRYLIDVAGPSYVPLAFYLAAYYAIFVWLAARVVARRGDAHPIAALGALAGVWALLELCRGDYVLSGYSFFNLAQPLISVLGPVGSVLGVAGCAGLLMWVVFAMLGPWRTNQRRASVGLAVPVGIIMVLWAAGPGFDTFARPARGPDASASRKLVVGIVQTDLPQSNKIGWGIAERLQAFGEWLELSAQAAAAGADVVVWPETMYPGRNLQPEWTALERREGIYLPYKQSDGRDARLYLAELADVLTAAQQKFGVPMLIGAIGADGVALDRQSARLSYQARYNSMFLLSDGAVSAQRYDKMRLTPFGEFIPIAWRFPSVQNAIVGLGAKGMRFDLGHGSTPRVFELKTKSGGLVRTVTPICFEMTYPGTCRELVMGKGALGGWAAQRQADLIITPSNDGWFGTMDEGRYEHLRSAQWRAAELGTPVVRVVNTGISCVIDAHGRVIGPRLAEHQQGVLTPTVDINTRETLYSRWGDWPVLLWGLLSAAWCLFACFSPRFGHAAR